VQGSYFSPSPSEGAELTSREGLAWLLPLLAVVAGVAGVVAVWVALGALTQSSASWMGLVAAVDIALLLRLTHAPPGAARTLLAAFATLAAVLAAQWLLAALRVGVWVGMEPLASAARLGPALGWQVVKLGLDRVDWVLLAAALPLAAILVEAEAKAAD
jgi:hypothetical protein